MERKVSLYILLPEYNKRINYLVPQSMSIRTMVKLICKTLKKTGVPVDDHMNYSLISMATGMSLEMNKSVYAAGINDGYELLLIGDSNG